MTVLQPMIDSGELVVPSGQTDFEKVAILRWDPATAPEAHGGHPHHDLLRRRQVNGVLSPYDGLSLGIIAALKGAGYGSGGKDLPVVTGQDAEVASVKSILAGEQYSTVFKDTRELAKVTVEHDRGARSPATSPRSTTPRPTTTASRSCRPTCSTRCRRQGQRPDGAGRLGLLHRGRRSSSNRLSGRDPGARPRGPAPQAGLRATRPRSEDGHGTAASSRCVASPRSSPASRRSPTSTSPSGAARSTRSAARTAPASHPDEGAQRGLPARQLRGRDRLRGRAGRVLATSATARRAGIVIIHQELALIPELSIAENIFLGNETAPRRRDRLERGQPPGHRAAGPGRPATRTRSPRSSTSASASSSWSRSPRRCPRRSSSSSSTSRPPRSTTTTPRTCSTCSRACRARASPRS